MNVSGPLLLLLLTAACTVSGDKLYGSALGFKNQIDCVQPAVILLKYLDYGCYCGLGGKGTPVDRLDQCCKIHDDCYGAQMSDPECQSFLKLPYLIPYGYKCSGGRPTCSASNNKCQAAACECDRKAALCFARVKYNPKYYNLDQTLCEK